MRAIDWIREREPSPPPHLQERLAQLLADEGDVAEGELAASLTRASQRVVAALLARGGVHRDSALELLAADALATYAFEAQAEHPDVMDERCGWAMRHLSGLADGDAAVRSPRSAQRA